MYKILIGVFIVLILGAGGYYFYSKSQSVNSVAAISTNGWLTYDGGTWTIQYPPSYSPETKHVLANTTDVQFNSNENTNALISAHQSDLSTDPVVGQEILQRDPNKTDVLGTLLQIQTESAGGGINSVSAQKITINNTQAAQYISEDTSDPSHPTYEIQTAFNQGDQLVMFTFSADSDQSDPMTEQIYNAMLASFRFK